MILPLKAGNKLYFLAGSPSTPARRQQGDIILVSTYADGFLVLVARMAEYIVYIIYPMVPSPISVLKLWQ